MSSNLEQLFSIGLIGLVVGFFVGRTQRSKQSSQSNLLANQAKLELPPELKEKIRSQLRNGKKIEAIKELRQATNKGLKESKDIVESIAEEQ